MERLHFSLFSNPITQRVTELLTPNSIVLRVNVSKEDLWNTYLNAYPEELNQIFRERKHYDGQADRQFIVRMGALVVLNPETLELSNIWDINTTGYFQDVANTMNAFIKSKVVEGFHIIAEPSSGSLPNVDNLNTDITWHHFFTNTPTVIQSQTPTSDKAELQATVKSYATIAEEFTVATLETVLDLCDNIYRGTEFKSSVKYTLDFLKAYEEVGYNPLFLYTLAKKPNGFRNSVIGKLAQDLQEGKNLTSAVASYENMVAPTNYRRSTAIVTPQMISIAEKEISDKGVLHELYRQPANIRDVPVSELLYTFTPTTVSDLFSSLKQEASTKVIPNSVKSATEITYTDLLDILKENKVENLELLVDSSLTNNAMTLFTGTTPFEPTTNILKWNNPVSWMYKGGVSDSIQERVKTAGGTINADFRVSLAWNNSSDYDLSVHSPYGLCNFSNRNKGQLKLDVDANGGHVTNSTDPVENIYGNNVTDGTYKVIVDMFNLRSAEHRKEPFQLQVKVGDTLHNYYADKLISSKGGSRHVHVLELQIVNGQLVSVNNLIPDQLKESSTSSSVIHNLNTNHFYPVQGLTRSPNFWGEDKTGNEHLFFLVEDMKIEDELNTFLPEYLNSSLQPIRKALELISSKVKVKLDADIPQTTGFGFSTTMSKNVIVRVTLVNKQQRIFNVKFGS